MGCVLMLCVFTWARVVGQACAGRKINGHILCESCALLNLSLYTLGITNSRYSCYHHLVMTVSICFSVCLLRC